MSQFFLIFYSYSVIFLDVLKGVDHKLVEYWLEGKGVTNTLVTLKIFKGIEISFKGKHFQTKFVIPIRYVVTSFANIILIALHETFQSFRVNLYVVQFNNNW